MDNNYFNTGVYLFNNYKIEVKGCLQYISGFYNLNTKYRDIIYQSEFYIIIINDTSKKINIPIVQIPNLVVPYGFEHIYPDKTCCLGLNYEVEKAWKNSRTFENFLIKILDPFLINLISYQTTNKCIMGEHPHALNGFKDYYKQYFSKSTNENIITILNYCKRKIIRNDIVKGHNDCPCGSGNIIRKCIHYNELINFITSTEKNTNLKDAFIKDMEMIGER